MLKLVEFGDDVIAIFLRTCNAAVFGSRASFPVSLLCSVFKTSSFATSSFASEFACFAAPKSGIFKRDSVGDTCSSGGGGGGGGTGISSGCIEHARADGVAPMSSRGIGEVSLPRGFA